MEKYLIASFETYAREPILRRMNDGSLICFFLTGGNDEPKNDNVVAVCRSFDDGKTWSEPETLFSHSLRGVWCTEIFNENAKFPTAFVHTYCGSDCHYRELETFCSYSFDYGKTWSEPTSVIGAINGCSIRQCIVLSNGDVLAPLYWQETMKNFNFGENYSNMYETKTLSWVFRCGVGILPKGEQVWQRHGRIAAENLNLWEPNAVELEDGHIIMYIRTNKGVLYYSESFDYGRAWTQPLPTKIVHSDTKVTCLKINGKVIMINNAVESGRTHLEISSSENGFDFEHICYVDEPENRFFYPHAFADDKQQTLYVAYENMKEHWLKKFTYEELGL